MGIIIKYIIKSINEKRFRTALIIFAVALSGALYFASTSLAESLVVMYTTKMQQACGNADITIYATEKSPSDIISDAPALKFKEQMDYIIKSISGTGRYKIGTKDYKPISLLGMNLEDYKSMNDLQLIKERKGISFISDSMIISQKTAEKYQLDVGDRMEFYIEGVRRDFTVYGIALPIGMFSDESKGSNALVPYKSLCNYMQTDGKPTRIYIKVKEGISIEHLIEELKKGYPKYKAERPFSEKTIEDNTSMIATPLLVMTIIVSFMSIFIIYTSFKVITLEKMPVIGTFRSIGASKKTMNQVLFLESLFYGIVGGIAACGIGIGLLYVMTVYTTPAEIKQYMGTSISISLINLLITLVISITVSVVSSIAPIIAICKIPLKEVVLNNITSNKKGKTKKHIQGIICIALAFILPKIPLGELSIITCMIALICVLVGVINMLPKTIKMTSGLFSILFSRLFGNIGILAVKNIKGNKSILNSIALIAIGIATLLMINNISINVDVEIINAFKKSYLFDAQVSMNDMDKNSARGLLKQDGVESVYPVYTAYNVETKEISKSFQFVESVKDESYTQFVYGDYMGKQKELFQKMNTGRYLITSVNMGNRYHLKEGDKLTLVFPEGDRVYTIIGFVDSFINAGVFALVPEIYLRDDMGAKYYNGAYIKVKGDSDKALKALQKQYSDRGFSGMTLEEMLKNDMDSKNQLMSTLVGFSVLALVIGVIGVINNLIISFIERKQGIAILRSVGMSKKQVANMLFIEALYSGGIGGTAGITAGVIIMYILPDVLRAMQEPIRTYLISDILWVYLVGGILITVVSSITLVKRSSKLNIIESIKYE